MNNSSNKKKNNYKIQLRKIWGIQIINRILKELKKILEIKQNCIYF